jgi:hypothetical protein
MARHGGAEIIPAGPFRRRLQQFGAWLARIAPEIPDLARDEIERERFQLAELADIVVMHTRFRKIADLVAVRGITCCKHPLGEMPKLRLKAAARLVGVAARHETLIENLAPRMNVHAVGDVGIVHIGLGHRQPVVANPHGAAGHSRPVVVLAERLQAERQNVRLRPAMRFREEQIFAARDRRTHGTQPDIVRLLRMFETSPGPCRRAQFLALRKVRRHHQNDFERLPVQRLQLPSFPGALPLPAVKFQGNDDRAQRG